MGSLTLLAASLADALVTELHGVIADLRQDRDHWRDAFQQQQRLLPIPEQPGAQAAPKDAGGPILSRAWRWMRKAG